MVFVYKLLSTLYCLTAFFSEVLLTDLIVALLHVNEELDVVGGEEAHHPVLLTIVPVSTETQYI